jgi:hypothetical protein
MHALPSRRSRVLAGHRDVAARLVDEDEPVRVEVFRDFDESPPELLDPRRGLLGGGESLSFA